MITRCLWTVQGVRALDARLSPLSDELDRVMIEQFGDDSGDNQNVISFT